MSRGGGGGRAPGPTPPPRGRPGLPPALPTGEGGGKKEGWGGGA